MVLTGTGEGSWGCLLDEAPCKGQNLKMYSASDMKSLNILKNRFDINEKYKVSQMLRSTRDH